MSHPIFEKIVKDITAAAGSENWQELAGNGLLRIDGVQMQIQPAGSEQEEQILLYADFGELPSERTPDFLRMLLDINFMASVNKTRSFCTNPTNGQVIAILYIPLKEGMSGDDVIAILREESNAARTWQHEWPPTDQPAEPVEIPPHLQHMFKV